MSSDSTRPALHLPARYLAIVQDILRRYLPHAEVWAYGSRVNGDHYDASDLDLVVRQPDDLTRRQPDLDEVAAAFSDSDLPILVQIVDWARIPAAFREEIEAGYVVCSRRTLPLPRLRSRTRAHVPTGSQDPLGNLLPEALLPVRKTRSRA
jgi:predicted nucleotidyltransferase